MDNYDHTNVEHRIALALDFVKRAGPTDAAFDRAAHQYQVDRETLIAQYDEQYLRWAASCGLDY